MMLAEEYCMILLVLEVSFRNSHRDDRRYSYKIAGKAMKQNVTPYPGHWTGRFGEGDAASVGNVNDDATVHGVEACGHSLGVVVNQVDDGQGERIRLRAALLPAFQG